MNPTLNIDLEKLKANADTLTAALASKGVKAAFVTKVFCADEKMVEVLKNTDCAYLADSRLENLAKYGQTRQEKLLLRLPAPSQADLTVKYADISCNSVPQTVRALDLEAARQGKTHKIILMIDLGDLREGIFFEDAEAVSAFVKTAKECKNILLAGIGTNLTCYGGILPTEENMGVLVNLAKKIEGEIGRKLEIISGGNSSSFLFLGEGKMPRGINNLRLGESLLLGVETAKGSRIEGTFDDVVTLEAEIIELYKKPSFPIGERTVNAFGETGVYEDIGERGRAILAVGRQDTDFEGLVPVDNKITVVGASSDHLIIDVTGARGYNVGGTVKFKLKYGAALRAFTSPYVDKKYLNQGEAL